MEVTDFFTGILQNAIVIIGEKLFDALNLRSPSKKEKLISLIIKTLDAISATKLHIQSHNGTYVQSPDLVNLYHELLRELEYLKKENLIEEIPDYLHSKIRFWQDPQSHLNNQILLDAIPTLDKIKEACINVLKKL